MTVSLAFLLVTFVAAGLAWQSRQVATQKLGLMMLASWAASRLALSWAGAYHAPAAFAVIDALAASYTTGLLYRHRTGASLLMLGLFGVMAALHLVTALLGLPPSLRYFLCLNVLYSLQLAVVGGDGAFRLFRARYHRRPVVLRVHRPLHLSGER